MSTSIGPVVPFCPLVADARDGVRFGKFDGRGRRYTLPYRNGPIQLAILRSDDATATSHFFKVCHRPMCHPAPCGMMPTAPADVHTSEDLKNFIHISLCRKENLLEHHFPMTELELKRKGQHCGSQFILHGPRSVKLSAVWDRKLNEVLLYDAVGKRFARIRIPNAVA